MSGVVGQFFKEFGLTIAFAVLVSLFIAFTLTPMMAALYLPVGQHATGRLGRWWTTWNTLFEKMATSYASILHNLLQFHRKKTLGISAALFLLSMLLLPYLGSSFIPDTDQAQFTVKGLGINVTNRFCSPAAVVLNTCCTSGSCCRVSTR